MKRFLKIALFAFAILIAAVLSGGLYPVLAQDDDVELSTLSTASDGTWSPSARSATAMRHVLKEEDMFKIYTDRVTLSGPLAVDSMKFYDYNNRKVGTTKRTCKARDARKRCTHYEDIVIRSGVVVRFMPGDRTHGIVEGCLNEFTTSVVIRVPDKPSGPVVAIDRPDLCDEMDLTIEQARKIPGMQVDGHRCFIPQQKKVDCPLCPKTGSKGKTSKKERYLGGKKEAVASCVSGFIAAMATGSNAKGALLKGCVPSVAVQRVQQAINPSQDIIVITDENGSELFRVHKGTPYASQDEHWKVEWSDDTATIYYDGQICKVHTLRRSSNLAVIAIPTQKRSKTVGTIPQKIVTPGVSEPVRPPTPNRSPSAIGTVPTRATIGGVTRTLVRQ